MRVKGQQSTFMKKVPCIGPITKRIGVDAVKEIMPETIAYIKYLEWTDADGWIFLVIEREGALELICSAHKLPGAWPNTSAPNLLTRPSAEDVNIAVRFPQFTAERSN